MRGDILVERVEIVDVMARPVCESRPPLAEVSSPNIVSVEHNLGLITQLLVQLVKNVVLLKAGLDQTLSEFEDSIKDT